LIVHGANISICSAAIVGHGRSHGHGAHVVIITPQTILWRLGLVCAVEAIGAGGSNNGLDLAGPVSFYTYIWLHAANKSVVGEQI